MVPARLYRVVSSRVPMARCGGLLRHYLRRSRSRSRSRRAGGFRDRRYRRWRQRGETEYHIAAGFDLFRRRQGHRHPQSRQCGFHVEYAPLRDLRHTARVDERIATLQNRRHRVTGLRQTVQHAVGGDATAGEIERKSLIQQGARVVRIGDNEFLRCCNGRLAVLPAIGIRVSNRIDVHWIGHNTRAGRALQCRGLPATQHRIHIRQ
jgi:hypothetical protein